MASSLMDRIEILILDAAEQKFCSFCINFNISTVIGFIRQYTTLQLLFVKM
jgi:hypothetical protein